MQNPQKISQSAMKELDDFLSHVPAEMQKISDEICKELHDLIIPVIEKGVYGYATLLATVESSISLRIKELPQTDQNLLLRSLIARLATHSHTIIELLGLPESVRQLYPKAFGRLVHHIKNNENEIYDFSNDFFRKDISLVLGLLIPCGGMVTELNACILYRSIARSLFRSGNFKSLIKYFRVNGTGPWFRIHLDSRYLDEFNEPGYDAVYLIISDLLEKFPFIRGMIGTTWLYDPELLTISPHLTFLHNPLERGAFMLRHGTNPLDIERATRTSKTRRALYKEGKYVPVSHTLLWPRKSLITWAKKYNADKVDFSCQF